MHLKSTSHLAAAQLARGAALVLAVVTLAGVGHRPVAAGSIVSIVPAAPVEASEQADEQARGQTGPQVAPQSAPQDTALVLAVIDAAMEAISAEDMVAFTDLMLEDAAIFSVMERDGQTRLSARTRAVERAQTLDVDVVERGFEPEVRIAGPLATVWLPYDLYLDGEWSHCGVDTFTLLRVDGTWKIASLSYTVEQPPACRAHPDGPPR